MARHGGEQRRTRPPLNANALEALALRYVSRYATTEAKLRDYLARKLQERGWEDDRSPGVSELVARMAALGYVDDRAFAVARGQALLRRGYGDRRIAASLRASGIGEDDAAPAREQARVEASAAALALARRRRLGPFATAPVDPEGRHRAIAILVRAGHDYDLARRIASLAPGATLDDG